MLREGYVMYAYLVFMCLCDTLVVLCNRVSDIVCVCSCVGMDENLFRVIGNAESSQERHTKSNCQYIWIHC